MLPIIKTALKIALGRGVRASYGQFGEDAYVQSLLKHITRGTYVDIGSYHPVLYSNTYALYRRGWKGIVVDPNEDMRSLFRVFRPRDTFVHAAAGAEAVQTYYRFSDGAYNTFDAEEADVRKKLPRLQFLGSTSATLTPLSHILHGVAVDFLNIDAEGKDLEILESHHWTTYPKVIAIEDHTFNVESLTGSAVYRFLKEKGYALSGFCGVTLVFSHPAAR